MGSDFKDRLKKMKENDAWKDAQTEAAVPSQYINEIADGKYEAMLTNAEIGESKASSRLQITWEWTILVGQFAGLTKLDFDGLDDPSNFKWLLVKLKTFGYSVQDLDPEDLEDLLPMLVQKKITAMIRLKTKVNNNTGQSFQNTYIDRILISKEAPTTVDHKVPPAVVPHGAPPSLFPEVPDESDPFEQNVVIGSKVRFVYRKKQCAGVVEAIDTVRDVATILHNGVSVECELDGVIVVE